MKFAYAEMFTGAAGEHLVCADLLLRAIPATRTGIPGAWDVVAETERGIVRIQVKTTERARPYAQKRQQHVIGYTWAIRHGKGGLRSYVDGIVDIFALVALDSRQIAYVPFSERKQTFQIASAGYAKSRTAKRFEDYSWERALALVGKEE